MAQARTVTVDGNEGVASVAHRVSEVIVIYPITPSSPMGEFSDEWSAQNRKNIWGTVPLVSEMQSEAGAAGAIHGALQAGSLSTTFTCSQGLLLMIPNMYKIAGELTPFVMHVSARTLAAHALSIFGDHSDVMACRQIGFAMLSSASVQQAHDFALIAHAATLRARVPFLHFFDGFRTSHEVMKIKELTDDDLRALLPDELIAAHRARALTPDRPVIRGTAQNPDVFFQAREACNKFYLATPRIVQQMMDEFAKLTGRAYKLFEYMGDPQAERVIVLMGSAAQTAEETVDYLAKQGQKVGLLAVRLFRPWDVQAFAAALPKTVKAIAVLDRTKEAGAIGEPLYLDVVASLAEARTQGLLDGAASARVVGGRYGLASKEFTPACVKAVFDELAKAKPLSHFTVGINDDVTHLSLPVEPDFDIESADVKRGVFFGLGADGTVGANKNSIKIISEETDNFGQGYFVYDSKKSGAITISHLRFGPREIRSEDLIKKSQFVACHQFNFLEKYDVLGYAAPGGTLLLNSPYSKEEVWQHLPSQVQAEFVRKKLKLYVIDAYKVARDTGMGVRINTIMQTCFFAISGVLSREEAIAQIKKSIKKTYGKKGDEVVQKNFAAVDHTLAHLFEVAVPSQAGGGVALPPVVPDNAPDFVKRVTAVIMKGDGDTLPVSAFDPDGTWPVGTTKWEKRNIAQDIPVWEPDICIQCNKCGIACPHSTVRPKVYQAELLKNAPAAFKSAEAKMPDYKGWKFTIQIAPEDCTGCGLCASVCPAKDKANPKRKALNMAPQLPLREQERKNWDFFLNLPEADRSKIKVDVRGSQLFQPLFEFCGACSGCGETPYVKLLSQLFGDRLLIGNATGCSSIYGGNLPTTPYTTNRDGRGPAWSNSLFEDAAEFGFGMRLAVDKLKEYAGELCKRLAGQVGETLVDEILKAEQGSEAGIAAQRQRVVELRKKLAGLPAAEARRLNDIADYLVKKSVWCLGGDGWAYDIGYGGVDHVLAQSRDINMLVMDTEVYSNTGGQASKATPMGASAKFAMAGKGSPKKDIGLMAMTYGSAYVAHIALGSNDAHAVRAFQEADSFPGPSLVIAYSHCIAHGYDLINGFEQQKLAVQTGHWPLYRFDPRRMGTAEPPLKLDSGAPKVELSKYIYNETRYRMLEKINPERTKALLHASQADITMRFAVYEQLAKIGTAKAPPKPEAPAQGAK
ncbi:MAG: pyruvate:ferredoxin (flavodoxin) oxidoreductase [Planctomycetota bacterium]